MKSLSRYTSSISLSDGGVLVGLKDILAPDHLQDPQLHLHCLEFRLF